MEEILKLLRNGCEIYFTNGYVIHGDPKTGYIDTGWIYCGEYMTDGLRSLDIKGLEEALNDANNFNLYFEK